MEQHKANTKQTPTFIHVSANRFESSLGHEKEWLVAG